MRIDDLERNLFGVVTRKTLGVFPQPLRAIGSLQQLFVQS
jgi:hypothetical protein